MGEADASIFTIGYGNRSTSEFVRIILEYGIRYLIDVRSKPVSRFNQGFNQTQLEQLLKSHRIRYVFMGNELGGLPECEECYTNGRVDYSKLEAQPFYGNGINRLKTAWEKKLPVVVMCTELRPEECHRSKLIGQTLNKMGIIVSHIDQMGKIITQDEAINRITKGQVTLFEEVFSSRKKYLK